jgi:hypothetical protein
MDQIAEYYITNGYTILFDKIDKNIIRIQADKSTDTHFYHLIYTELGTNATLVINTYNNDVIQIKQTIFRNKKYLYKDFLRFIEDEDIM